MTLFHRMLGYDQAIDVGYDARFGPGTGPIWMDGLQCNGTEERLDYCDFPGWGVHNCYHWEDASVVCSSESLLTLTPHTFLHSYLTHLTHPPTSPESLSHPPTLHFS